MASVIWVLFVLTTTDDYRTSPSAQFHEYRSEESCQAAGRGAQSAAERMSARQRSSYVKVEFDCKGK